MKLFGAIAIHVAGEDILRAPRFFEKIKRAFGGKPDLRTGKMRASLEATAIVEAARDALRSIGVSNAISLVVDDTVLFHDREGRADDLGDLFLAFHDNDSVFGQGFRELRLAVEHHEAGMHSVIEMQARSEHARDAAAVRVLVSGRVDALTPKAGEDAEAYKRRAEPIANDPKGLELYRLQFSAFVDRVRDALAAAMPTARVVVEVAEPRVVRPDANATPGTQPPSARTYDPYDYYYPYPMATMFAADMLMWTAMFSMMSMPHYAVVDHSNVVQGYTDESGIENGPTTSSETGETGDWWTGSNEDAGAAEAPEADSDGGSWWDDGGGDAGGGDVGGGDFGGGDFGGDFGGGFD